MEGTRSAKEVIYAKYKPELVLGGQKTDVKQESECASGRSCDRGVDKKEKKKNRNPEKSEKCRKKRNSNIERAQGGQSHQTSGPRRAGSTEDLCRA